MPDDTKKKYNGKKNPWRTVFAVLAFYSGWKLLEYAACWIIGNVLGGISFSVPAASVGIIGGADGPTAIFVTATAKPDWQLILWIFLLAVGIFGFLKLRGHGKK